MLITQERLKELLHYDPETGVFRWKKRTQNSRVIVGGVAGTEKGAGYIRIRVDGKPYAAHRLAWFYVYGVWPTHLIDHINGVRGENRISNLRVATKTQNGQNQRKKSSNSTSGYLGVSFHKGKRKWTANVCVGGRLHHIGSFNCPTAAYLLGYLPAKRRLHEFNTL